MIRIPSALLVQEGYFQIGDLVPAFQETKAGQSVPFCASYFQVILIQNNMLKSHTFG